MHTFLFADLAGFTALTEAHGDEQAADLAGEFSHAAGRLLPRYDAEQIKTIGDALMLRVGTPAGAVKLRLALTHNPLAECGYPTIRVGMHHGTAVHRAGDWFGATINLAARVSGLAHGGDVLMTDATRERAGEIADVLFEAHGVHHLLKVTRPVKVFAAVAVTTVQSQLVIDPVCRMAVNPDSRLLLLLAGMRSTLRCGP